MLCCLFSCVTNHYLRQYFFFHYDGIFGLRLPQLFQITGKHVIKKLMLSGSVCEIRTLIISFICLDQNIWIWKLAILLNYYTFKAKAKVSRFIVMYI